MSASEIPVQPPSCGKCGASSRFVRVVADRASRGKFEIKIYQCTKCGAQIDEIVARRPGGEKPTPDTEPTSGVA
jgi:ribosomal protein S27AE